MSIVQETRNTYERQQAMIRDLHMIQRTLNDHAKKLEQNAAPQQLSATHLERLLRRHETGERRLKFFEAWAQDLGDSSEPTPELGACGQALVDYLLGRTTRQPVIDTFQGETKSLAGTRSVLAFIHRLHTLLSNELIRVQHELNRRIADHLAALDQSDGDPLTALDWQAPIAMLPVRLETRFAPHDAEPTELMVRVYPDQIHVNTHENALTEEEQQWGRAFWAYLWYALSPADREQTVSALPDKHLAETIREFASEATEKFSGSPKARYAQIKERAWAQGVERFGAERSAFIVRTLTPLMNREPVGGLMLEGFEAGRSLYWDGASLTFPDVDLQYDTWEQPPTARLLPDRWIAYAFFPVAEGEELETGWEDLSDNLSHSWQGRRYARRVTSRPIREPLHFNPGDNAWMTDFDEAVQAGMGFTLPLPRGMPAVDHQHILRLIVVGFKATMDAPSSSDALRDQLFAAQHTDGLELLNPGTPTNNADKPSHYSTRRPPAHSLGTIAGKPLDQPGTDAARLANAFGIPSGVFGHVSGADSTRQQDARAMNQALWPATLGYYARNLWQRAGASTMLGATWSDNEPLDEGLPPLLSKLEAYRQHFVDFVRAGGPLPTLRIGSQPYGVLPVSPVRAQEFELSSASNEGSFQAELGHHLQNLLDWWLDSAKKLPAAESSLSNQELLTMFSQEPVACAYRRWKWLLDERNPLVSGDPGTISTQIMDALERVGIDHKPRIADLRLGQHLFSNDLPVADDLKPVIDLLFLGLDSADPVDSLRVLQSPQLSDVRSTLLRQLIIVSTTEALISSRIRLGARNDDYLTFPPEPTSYEDGDETIFEQFGSPYADDIKKTVQHVDEGRSGASPDPVLADYLRALKHIKTIDAAELPRLTSETLDLASHRLDAWWTSLATRRLEALRSEEPAAGSIHIGAFGFVENLRPGSGPNMEYLLAPSLEQATTAAVLRGVHKSRGEPFALDLSAPRVRKAQRLFDAVRDGLSLGDVLGSRFERGLRAKNLEKYIHDFRRMAPGVQGEREDPDKTGGQENDIVDGLELYHMWRDNGLALDFVEPDSHEADSPKEVISNLLQDIGETMDAARDLFLAEGVHHATHGRPERAAAALEAMSRAGYPPVTEVMSTSRTEAGVNHRLMVIFGKPTAGNLPDSWRPDKRDIMLPGDLPDGHVIDTGPFFDDEIFEPPEIGRFSGTDPSIPISGMDDLTFGDDEISTKREQVRYLGEPNLNLWAGQLLPTPDRIGCTGEFRWTAQRSFAAGTFQTPGERGSVTVKGVGFSPDVLLFTAHDGQSWSHGIFRRGVDSASDQQIAGAMDGGLTPDKTLVLPSGTSGQVTETHRDGFTVAFDGVGDSVTVIYRALQTINPYDVELRTENLLPPPFPGYGPSFPRPRMSPLSEGPFYDRLTMPDEPESGQVEVSGETSIDIATQKRPGLIDVTMSDRSSGTPRIFGTVHNRAAQHWLPEETAPRITTIHDHGFSVDLSGVEGLDLLISYRVWPAEPSEQTFKVPMSITLDKLRLMPLDAISMIQGSGEAGDSQLERRIRLYAFRHKPSHSPPIPSDAKLKLMFSDLPDEPGVDVTISDTMEAGHAIRDVLAEGRPVDARDLSHPGQDGGRGYFQDDSDHAGTLTHLRTRAHTVRKKLSDVQSILRNRIALLEDENSVTGQVDRVEKDANQFHDSVPLQQVKEVTGKLSGVQASLWDELMALAERLSAGSTEENDDLEAAAGGTRTLHLPTAFEPGSRVQVTMRSFSDAVHFSEGRKSSNAASDGSVTVDFDFTSIPPGTAFTLHAESRIVFPNLPPGILGFYERFGRGEQPPPMEQAQVFNGRVAADPDEEFNLAHFMADELDLLPRLLWLNRLFADLHTDADGAGAMLHNALEVAQAQIDDEIDLISRLFSHADMDAIQALQDFLRGDALSDLSNALEQVLKPVRWTGLDAIVDLTGLLDRPDQQRMWLASGARVKAPIHKDAQGQVRARLKRLSENPAFESDLRPEHRAYSATFQSFIRSHGVDPAFVKALEQLLADPAATHAKLAPETDNLLPLLHALHDLMHHENVIDTELKARVRELFDALSHEQLSSALSGLVDDPQALLGGIEAHGADLVAMNSGVHHNGSPSDVNTDFRSALATLGEKVDHQQRVTANLLSHPEPAGAFREGVLEGLRHALLQASYFGIYGSTPASAAGGTSEDEAILLKQARNTQQEIEKRLAAAGRSDTSTAEGQVHRLQALLGDSFTVLPPFLPTNASELQSTFAASDTLLGEDTYAPDTWLQRISRIREQPAMFQKVRTYADAFALSAHQGMRPQLTVGQLPHNGQGWIGRDDVQPQGGEVVFGVDFATQPFEPSAPVAGLFIDDWVVSLPRGKQTLGVGLQYDDPNSRAPQSILLAVPPAWQQEGESPHTKRWTQAMLLQTIEETVDVIPARAVDFEDLGDLRQVLPALCFPYNVTSSPYSSQPDAPTVHFDRFNWEGKKS